MILSTLLSAAAALQSPVEPSEPIILLVNYESQPTDSELSWYASQGLQVKYRYATIPALAVVLDASQIDAVAERPGVEFVEADSTAHLSDISNTWGVEYIGGRYTLADGYDGAGIKVGIIDTGIDYNHPELSAVYSGGWDFVNGDNDPMDDHLHGTHVAGTIAAQADGVGVVGLAPGVEIYSIKGFDAAGSGQTSDLIACVDWTTTNGMDVVNNSWGGGHTATLRRVFEASQAAGVIQVCASGNNYGLGGVSAPARYDSTYAIGAINIDGNLANFSDRGPELDFTAPGVDVNSCALGGGYSLLSGTSMATPHAVGSVALLLAHGGLIDEDGDGHLFEEVRNRLAKVAIDRGDPGRDNRYGHGIINAHASMVEPMLLDTSVLIAGQAGTVFASGCTPGDSVAFLYGARTARQDLPQAGTVIGIRGASLLRLVTADGSGTASLTVNLPGVLTGYSTSLQAVEASSNSSQVLAVTVQ
jgi:subtilisin